MVHLKIIQLKSGKSSEPDIHDFSVQKVNFSRVYLEDHPRTGKWLVTLVSFPPLSFFVSLPNGLNVGFFFWGGGVTNHFLNWMILQVGYFSSHLYGPLGWPTTWGDQPPQKSKHLDAKLGRRDLGLSFCFRDPGLTVDPIYILIIYICILNKYYIYIYTFYIYSIYIYIFIDI